MQDIPCLSRIHRFRFHRAHPALKCSHGATGHNAPSPTQSIFSSGCQFFDNAWASFEA